MNRYHLRFLCLFSILISSTAFSQEFYSNFDKAMQKAKAENKPVIAIFSASWCGPCKKMKAKVYPSAEVAPYHNRFVWAYLDADAQANRSLMKSFGVTGIPHITYLSATGEKMGMNRGSMSSSQFASILSSKLSSTPAAAASTEKKPGLMGIFKKKQ